MTCFWEISVEMEIENMFARISLSPNIGTLASMSMLLRVSISSPYFSLDYDDDLILFDFLMSCVFFYVFNELNRFPCLHQYYHSIKTSRVRYSHLLPSSLSSLSRSLIRKECESSSRIEIGLRIRNSFASKARFRCVEEERGNQQ